MNDLDVNGSMPMAEQIRALLLDIFQRRMQPSAPELVEKVETELGLEARWDIKSVIISLISDKEITGGDREYLGFMIEDGSLDKALQGEKAPVNAVGSTIDALISESKAYQSSEAFQEMISFMGRFRDYAPFNCILVRLQNPTCGFFATKSDWENRFGRQLKEDARPMVILAPMHPVLLVYDLDQTEGEQELLPEELLSFSKFEGAWNPDWMARTIKNAIRHRVRIDFKTLSTTHGGFATFSRGTGKWKMRIAVHDKVDEPSRFGVLCHELAHILLGHLGSDEDLWWPARSNLDRGTAEVEAEAVAYIVNSRLGLGGSSAAYVSGYLKDNEFPTGISIDLIAKVSGKIERMTQELLPAPRVRSRGRRKAAGL